MQRFHLQVTIGALRFDISLDDGFNRAMYRSTDKHNHSVYEIHFITGGSGTLLINNAELTVGQNTWYAVGPGVYHAIKPNGEDPLTRCYLQFTFDEPSARDRGHCAEPSETEHIRSVLKQLSFFRKDTGAIPIETIGAIHREIKCRPVGFYSRIQALFTLLLTDLIREMIPETTADYTMPAAIRDDMRSSLIDAFFDRYDEQLTIAELAKQLHLSTKQTGRVIEELYKTTFKQKLLDTRIEVAKDLLVRTPLAVGDIAERVGYSLQRNFGQVFRNKTGFSPSAYRRSARNGFGGQR
ncbi:AraC family transcriptional regulator [Paenibacillus hemerocallicola]|nr:AraC family transcriptional regulator [Paenibacillus hemerocallicola]